MIQDHINFRNYQVDTSASWVEGGENLAKLCFERDNLRGHGCMKNTKKEVLIAFTNSKIWGTPFPKYCNTLYKCVVIGTDPASDYANMVTWAGSAFQMPVNGYSLRAAWMILRCMRRSCCRRDVTFPLRDDNDDMDMALNNLDKFEMPEMEERQTSATIFEYMDSDDKEPKVFRGTYEEFQDKVVKPRNRDPQDTLKG